MTPYLLGGLVPIHSRHLVVKKQRIEVGHLGKPQPLMRGDGGNDDVSRSFKQRFFTFQNRPAVVDTQQHAARSLVRSTHGGTSSKMGQPLLRGEGCTSSGAAPCRGSEKARSFSWKEHPSYYARTLAQSFRACLCKIARFPVKLIWVGMDGG